MLLQHCGTDRNASLIRSVILKSWWYITLHGRAPYQLPSDNVWMHPVLRGRGSENTYAVGGIILEGLGRAVLSIHPHISFIYLLVWTGPFDWMLIMLSVSSFKSANDFVSGPPHSGRKAACRLHNHRNHSAPLSSLRISILTVALLVLHLNNRANDVIFWTNLHTNRFFSISPSLIKFRGQCFCH